MTDGLKTLPVWMINLPRATDRRVKMVARLEKIGLNFTLYPGIDGKANQAELLKSVDVKASLRNMGRPILIGGIGCYHSHLGVWKEFLETSSPIALVLEDDVVFREDFLTAIQLAIEAEAHWDLLKLNCIRAKLPVTQMTLGHYQLNAYVGPNTGTGAYLIKRETAKKLLSKMLPITRATDHEINRFFLHDFRLRGLEPFPSYLDDGESLIATGPNGYGGVRKFPWYRRLPNYLLRTTNYFRRAIWLGSRGELLPQPWKIFDSNQS